MSLRISWIGRFLSDNVYPWKAYLLHLLEPFGGELFLPCDYNINDYNISPIFYKELLHWWSDIRSRFDLASPVHVKQSFGTIILQLTENR